jgi:ArsR family transcriptional regulator, virulence genes transcriptional regulator
MGEMSRRESSRSLHPQMARQAGQAAKFLRVLSNRHRLRVLCLLLESEMSVGELNSRIPVSQSVLSQHLAVLRRNRLVRTRRAAQTIHYSVAPGPVHGIIEALYAAFCAKAPSRPPKSWTSMRGTRALRSYRS